MDHPVRRYRGGEIQPDAKLPELNCDCRKTSAARTLHYRIGEFPTSQEAGFLPPYGQKIRLRQDLQYVVALKRLDRRGQIDVLAKQEDVEQITHTKRCRRS